MMGEIRQFKGGKPSHEKIKDAVDAVNGALWENLEGQPLAVALGVLDAVKHQLLRDHET